jgi:hypothetical protein
MLRNLVDVAKPSMSSINALPITISMEVHDEEEESPYLYIGAS